MTDSTHQYLDTVGLTTRWGITPKRLKQMQRQGLRLRSMKTAKGCLYVFHDILEVEAEHPGQYVDPFGNTLDQQSYDRGYEAGYQFGYEEGYQTAQLRSYVSESDSDDNVVNLETSRM